MKLFALLISSFASSAFAGDYVDLANAPRIECVGQKNGKSFIVELTKQESGQYDVRADIVRNRKAESLFEMEATYKSSKAYPYDHMWHDVNDDYVSPVARNNKNRVFLTQGRGFRGITGQLVIVSYPEIPRNYTISLQCVVSKS
jgi:hypothetical protein